MLKREMPPVHPGNVLKEMYMQPLDISVTDLADNLGVHRRTISLLINEHSGISAEMALRLATAFETTPELWLNMQQQYDLWYAGQKVVLKSIRHLVSPGTTSAPRKRTIAQPRRTMQGGQISKTTTKH